MAFRSGFVSIIGRPNAGKSTLVNRLVGQKVAIVSPKPQTTRSRIQGIVHRPDAQIVLIDTPGIHKPQSVLSRHMMNEVQQALGGIDILAFIADATRDFTPHDRQALAWLRPFHGAAFLLLNKIDRIHKEWLLPRIAEWRTAREFSEIFPISALTGSGLAELLRSWIGYLPEHPPYFPPDQFTDQPERFLAAEFIREKAIRYSHQEVPHAVAVIVERFEETSRLLRIYATVYVERQGQKAILVGKGGGMIKRIGSEARKDLERLLGAKIFLSLVVKVLPNWRQRPAVVRHLDWRRQLEQLEKDALPDAAELTEAAAEDQTEAASRDLAENRNQDAAESEIGQADRQSIEDASDG